MAIKGNLKDMSLTSLVQVICLEGRRASVFLNRRGEKGVIFFDKGEIAHATIGSLVGEEAVYQLVNWTEGMFQVNDCETIPQRTVDSSWNRLLLEGMRRVDEQSTIDAARTQFHTLLSPDEIEQDTRLENELISLLSNLEHLRAQLVDKKSREQASLALQTLIDMVNHVVDFSEEHTNGGLKVGSLKEVLLEAADEYPAAQLLKVQHSRLTDNSVMLHQTWKGDPLVRQQTFHQIVESLLAILETYFVYFTTSFRSASVTDQWSETCIKFLADLAWVVEEIQF